MKESVKILKEALLTEKATMLSANLNQHAFSVSIDSDKRNVKDAVESTFGVKVLKVNTPCLPNRSPSGIGQGEISWASPVIPKLSHRNPEGRGKH